MGTGSRRRVGHETELQVNSAATTGNTHRGAGNSGGGSWWAPEPGESAFSIQGGEGLQNWTPSTQ